MVGQIDANGNLQASGEYDVYGNARGVQTGTFTSNHRFVGHLGHTTDAETGGLIYMQARYCDPATGRFTSEDPGRNGENWFGYCGGDPTNMVDKDGKAAGLLPGWLVDFIKVIAPGIPEGWGGILALVLVAAYALYENVQYFKHPTGGLEPGIGAGIEVIGGLFLLAAACGLVLGPLGAAVALCCGVIGLLFMVVGMLQLVDVMSLAGGSEAPFTDS